LGWRADNSGAWTASGVRIGWVDHADLYLDPAASYGAAQCIAGLERISISTGASGQHVRLIGCGERVSKTHPTRRGRSHWNERTFLLFLVVSKTRFGAVLVVGVYWTRHVKEIGTGQRQNSLPGEHGCSRSGSLHFVRPGIGAKAIRETRWPALNHESKEVAPLTCQRGSDHQWPASRASLSWTGAHPWTGAHRSCGGSPAGRRRLG
jgi:hypothetical protein